MDRDHIIGRVSIEDPILRIEIDGIDRAFDLSQHSKTLARATPAERAKFEISPTGYGIHWPDVDEDLSIDGMIRDNQELSTS